MAGVTTDGPYAHLIVTPEMVPPDPEPLEAAAARHTAVAEQLEELYQQATSANAQREDAAQSAGFEVGHEVNREYAADIARGGSWHRGAAELHSGIAGVIRDVNASHANILTTAHEEIAAAKTGPERAVIIAMNNSMARMVAASGVEAMGGYHAYFHANYDTEYAVLSSRLGGGIADAPPAPAPGGGGIAVPVDHKQHKIDDAVGDDGKSDPDQGKGQDAASGSSVAAKAAGGLGTNGAEASDSAVPGTVMPAPVPGSKPSMPPIESAGLGGGGLGGGGLGGSGGGLGGGGLSGLGSSNPLSSLTSGLGGSGSPASGLGGMSGAAGGVPNAAGQAAAVNPASFSRGLSAGSSLGGAMPPVTGSAAPPATTVAGPQAGAVAPPAAAAVSSAGSSMPAGVAGSGVHMPVPAAPAGAAGPAAMMMPPPGMGAPAAPVTASAPVVSGPSPATMSASGPAATASQQAAGVVGGNAGPTLVPASVVTAGVVSTAAARRESPDVAAANVLAWELARACERVKYPLEWAVGVFRSPAGSETIVMSNDGAGYVPAGVFLPRSVRLLVADPLVDKAFRDRWFGWADPARTLVEYAGLRAGTEWKLVAAASTSSVTALREAKVDHGESCDPDRSPLGEEWSPPLLDELHVHRLALEYPDLYDRLGRLADVAPVYRHRAIFLTSLGLMDSLLGVDYPQELRSVWAAVKAGRESSPSVWANYANESKIPFLEPGLKRLGLFTNAVRPEDVATADHEVYRELWRVARVMEHVGGYSRQPLPLADMVYAAVAMGGPVDPVAELEPRLREIEEQLRNDSS
jgi:hypothetical protein